MVMQRGRTTSNIKLEIREHYGNRCQDCGFEPTAEHDDNLHVHRIHPGSRYSIPGCMILCSRCHKLRHKNPYRSCSGAAKLPVKFPEDLRDVFYPIALEQGLTPEEWVIKTVAEKVGREELAFAWRWDGHIGYRHYLCETSDV